METPTAEAMEQEVNVVNTFLQVSERNPKSKLRRSQTAPVTAEDALDDEATQGAADAAEKTEKVIEEFPSSNEEKKTVKKLLRTLPTLNRIATPEPWDLAALAESLEEDEAEDGEAVPQLPKVVGKPQMIHSATPDLWEWEAMVHQMPAPAVIVPPMPAPPTVAAPPTVTAPVQQAPVQQAPQAAAPSGVFQAQPPMVSLLTVPVTLAVPSSPPFTPPMSPSNSFPRLLGSVSPTSPGNGSPKVDSPTSFSTLRPGTLETSTVGSKEVVRWSVDGARFDSHQERILSPEFSLQFPGQPEPFSFRMVILATQTGGKHGAGFRKAKGRGSLELKCQSTVPSNVPNVAFSMSMGLPGHHGYQVASKTIWHNFVDKTCCPLRNGEELDWDFKQSVAGKGCEITVEVNFS